MTVQVAPVERKDVPIWLEGLGTVAAVQQVIVRPQVDGRLEKVLFVEGQPVKKGEMLAQIDPRPFLVSLHQAEGALARDKAQLETNQSNLKRYEGSRRRTWLPASRSRRSPGRSASSLVWSRSANVASASPAMACQERPHFIMHAPRSQVTGHRGAV